MTPQQELEARTAQLAAQWERDKAARIASLNPRAEGGQRVQLQAPVGEDVQLPAPPVAPRPAQQVPVGVGIQPDDEFGKALMGQPAVVTPPPARPSPQAILDRMSAGEYVSPDEGRSIMAQVTPPQAQPQAQPQAAPRTREEAIAAGFEEFAPGQFRRRKARPQGQAQPQGVMPAIPGTNLYKPGAKPPTTQKPDTVNIGGVDYVKVGEKLYDTSKPLSEQQGDAGKPGAGQEATDREYAKIYTETVGGDQTVATQSKLVKGAIDKMKSGVPTSGPVIGLLPKVARDVFTPEGASIQQDIERAVQSSMRATLGAQFTQKEGENILARVFNPRLSEEQNIANAQSVLDELQALSAQRTAANKYYEENNMSLKGYKGSVPKISDVEAAVDKVVGKETKAPKTAWDKGLSIPPTK